MSIINNTSLDLRLKLKEHKENIILKTQESNETKNQMNDMDVEIYQ